MNNRRKTTIALIHNNNKNRNELIFPKMYSLKREMLKSCDIELIFVGKQPIINEPQIFMVIFRKFLYWRVALEWNTYRKLRNKFLIFSVKDFLREIINICGLSKSEIINLKKNNFIETLVSDKHIRAWYRAYENDSDLLICFEDDAIFLENSIKELCNLLNEILTYDEIPPMYYDLAGGCPINDLKINKLEDAKKGHFQYYLKPVTNTACVYLLSKPLINEFIIQLINYPWIRLLGIDWLMNKIFILCNNKDVICAHANPHIFKHGTQEGYYKSWLSR